MTTTYVGSSTGDDTAQITAPGAVLIGALAGGIIAQGGFYLAGRLIVIALTVAAVGVALHLQRRRLGSLRPPVSFRLLSSSRPLWLFAMAAGGLAAWLLVRAAAAGGDWPAALAGVATLGVCVAAAALARPAMVAALTVIGVGVAVTSWAGVAFRFHLWAVPVEDMLWRGASTLTYPNAAAAVLAPLALIALARRAADPAMGRAVVAYVILVGLGSTLSRAGALAFAVGLAILVVAVRNRVRLAGPLLGAAVATGALLPSVPADHPARPLIALAGLALGLGSAVGPDYLGSRTARVTALVTGSVAVVGAGWFGVPQMSSFLLSDRVTLSSGEREGAGSAALRLVAQRPWVGHGPGLSAYTWSDGTGAYLTRLVHDEYLQTVVDLGAVGGLLLLALFAAAFVAVRRARRDSPLWIGGAAGLAAFVVHSGFDFLWHLAVLPLLAGVLLGLVLHGEPEIPPREESK